MKRKKSSASKKSDSGEQELEADHPDTVEMEASEDNFGHSDLSPNESQGQGQVGEANLNAVEPSDGELQRNVHDLNAGRRYSLDELISNEPLFDELLDWKRRELKEKEKQLKVLEQTHSEVDPG